MKKALLVLLISILGISFSAKAQQYNFSSVVSGNTLFFKITDNVNNHVEITTQRTESPRYDVDPAGAIVIPETITHDEITYTITSIGIGGFYDCGYITSIILPNTITSIESGAFSFCTGLTSIILPDNLTYLGAAFGECISLTSIIIPNTITEIRQYTFFHCYKLDSIVLPNSITSIGEYAFASCISLSSIKLSNTLISIGDVAFMGCKKLTSITFPETLTSIGMYAFAHCNGLKSITLPNSMTSIEMHTFSICSSITSITLPNSLVSIRGSAFYDCNSLLSIDLPKSLDSIGYEAFYRCASLTSITSNALIPPAIEESSFRDRPKDISISVPCIALEAYQEANEWKDFTNYQCFIGLNEILSAEIQTKLYPNPTNGISVLEIEGITKAKDVFVYDIMGRQVKTYKLSANQNTLEIDLTNFAKGIYQIKILDQTKKLIVN